MSETAATSRENAGVMERLKQLRLPLALVLALMASGMPGKANADGQANLKDTIGKLEEVKRTSDAEAAQARKEAAQLQKEADEIQKEIDATEKAKQDLGQRMRDRLKEKK
jgi:septal ring factor EnvC (AmiA/AmiB activator)